jgi:hypothetical protein
MIGGKDDHLIGVILCRRGCVMIESRTAVRDLLPSVDM